MMQCRGGLLLSVVSRELGSPTLPIRAQEASTGLTSDISPSQDSDSVCDPFVFAVHAECRQGWPTDLMSVELGQRFGTHLVINLV